MKENGKYIKIGFSDTLGVDGRPLIMVETLAQEELHELEDVDNTTPIYTFGELSWIGDGALDKGIFKVVEFLDKGPSIDTIMNPRRPFQDVIDLYDGPEEIEVLEVVMNEESDGWSEEEDDMVNFPQPPQRLN